MAFKFFTVPIQNSQEAAAEAELNAFLCSHKILSVDRRWVDQGPVSFCSFCVDYLDHVAREWRAREVSPCKTFLP